MPKQAACMDLHAQDTLQVLLADCNIRRLKAEGRLFCKQLRGHVALAELLTAADGGEAAAQAKLSSLTTVLRH